VVIAFALLFFWDKGCGAFFTFFFQCILGTGLPEPLHSNVTVLPFLAVTNPLWGTVRNEGGTFGRKENFC
jgi:Zn-dependent M16 (insulinase) family peptidase